MHFYLLVKTIYLGFLYDILQKINDLKNSAHLFTFGDSNDTTCSCAGVHNVCQYRSDADPKDLYHTWKITHKNVPKCCAEPYILKGYLLPHQPYR